MTMKRRKGTGGEGDEDEKKKQRGEKFELGGLMAELGVQMSADVVQRLEQVVEARMEERVEKATEEARAFRAKIRRAGASEIVEFRVTSPPSVSAAEAMEFLSTLNADDLTEYLLDMCEELGVDAQFAFRVPVGERAWVFRLSFESEKSTERVLKSERGGDRVLMEMLDERGILFGEYLAGVGDDWNLSLFTRLLRNDDEICSEVQQDAMQESESKTLEWLVRDGLYNPRFNTAAAMVSCGNTLALRMLVDEGYDPNCARSDGLQALSNATSPSAMVDALLQAGAKVELLIGTVTPPLQSLRRMLQLRPQETKAKFPGEQIFRHLSVCSRPILGIVELMREYDYPAPDMSIVNDPGNCIAFALFTFRYTAERPMAPTDGQRATLLWRTHTHYAFPPKVKDCVKTVLLCLKRVCPRLPRDLRNLLLLGVYGKTRAYVPGRLW